MKARNWALLSYLGSVQQIELLVDRLPRRVPDEFPRRQLTAPVDTYQASRITPSTASAIKLGRAIRRIRREYTARIATSGYTNDALLKPKVPYERKMPADHGEQGEPTWHHGGVHIPAPCCNDAESRNDLRTSPMNSEDVAPSAAAVRDSTGEAEVGREFLRSSERKSEARETQADEE